MTVCRGCGAFVQGDWDRCKICGHAPGDPVVVEDEADRRRKKSRKKAPKAKARVGATVGGGGGGGTATLAPPEPVILPHRLPAGFALEPPPAPVRTQRPPTPMWVKAAEVGLIAIILACVFVIVTSGEDGPDVDPSIPAAESDPAAGDPIWSNLPEWDRQSAMEPGFSVELPTTPLESSVTVRMPVIGELERHKMVVVEPGKTITVAWSAVPENMVDRPDLVLDGLVQGARDEVAGEVDAVKEVTVDGYLARRVHIDGVESDIRAVVIAGPEYMYELRVQGDGEDTVPYLQRLIDTFER
jgi:hypothetical protein